MKVSLHLNRKESKTMDECLQSALKFIAEVCHQDSWASKMKKGHKAQRIEKDIQGNMLEMHTGIGRCFSSKVGINGFVSSGL